MEQWLDAPKKYIFIPERVRSLKQLKRNLEDLLQTEGSDSEVFISMAPLGLGNAIIEFEDYDLMISDMERFYEIIRVLNNFEIHAIGDGKIRFSGVFPDIAEVQIL